MHRWDSRSIPNHRSRRLRHLQRNILTNQFINIMKNNIKKGFTLVELLVVIAIIACLAAIVAGTIKDKQQSSEAEQQRRGAEDHHRPTPSEYGDRQ